MADQAVAVNEHHVHKQTGDCPRKFGLIAMVTQVIFCVLFGLMTEYESAAGENATVSEERVTRVYGLFQDVHVMIFIGFGFLMTFLKKYSFSSVSYNFIVAALTIQWSIIVLAFIHMIHLKHWEKTLLTTESLVKGDFAAGAVLISFGAVLGRITPTQLLVMAVFEVIAYGINEHIGVVNLEVVDMGGSIFVHTWGAYFGLAVSWMLGKPPKAKTDERNSSSYNSDMFAMIGTIFLWMFWPSFNGALCPTANFARERVVINTVIALCASCVSAFAASRYFTEEQVFDMVHIQNATLAGGVAVGSSSDLVIGPWGAILVGMIAGIVSVLGYVYLSPFLEEKFNIFDTCGVHNLHGMPGVIGGVGGAISAAGATDKKYGVNVSAIFAARDSRSAGAQGGYQFAAVCVTLCIAIVWGLVVGCILKMMEQEHEPFSDQSHWELPGDVELDKAGGVHEEKVPLKEREEGVNLDIEE